MTAADPSHDYEYDLAHEVPPGPDPHLAQPPLPSPPPAHDLDPSTDYGFDEAHDL